MKCTAETSFDYDGEGYAEYQKDNRGRAADRQCLRNNIDANNSRNRYEDEAIENVPRSAVLSAIGVDDRAEQQGEDTENQVHKTRGLSAASVMAPGLWLEYTNDY